MSLHPVRHSEQRRAHEEHRLEPSLVQFLLTSAASRFLNNSKLQQGRGLRWLMK